MMINATNSFITFEEGSDQISKAFSIGIGIFAVKGMIVSALTFAYIVVKLKLNKYIKAILAIMTIVNFICSFLVALGLLLFYKNGCILNVFECQLITYSMVMMLQTLNMMSLMSMLRLYMARLAAKTKLIKHYPALTFIITASIINYSFAPLVKGLMETQGEGTALNVCMNESLIQPLYGRLLNVSKVCFFAIVGLYCDLSLYFFVKGRNKVQQQGSTTNIVPWKSLVAKDEMDLHIPIRASIMSLILSLLLFGFFAISIKFFYEPNMDRNLWPRALLGLLISNGIPLSLIMFAVNEKKAIASAQPPQKLQFHEKDEESAIQTQGLQVSNLPNVVQETSV